jgi:putative transposase
MQVSTSAYYTWRKRPGKLIDADVLHLHRRIKSLFKQNRNSLGSRELMKNLRKEGIEISRYKGNFSIIRGKSNARDDYIG